MRLAGYRGYRSLRLLLIAGDLGGRGSGKHSHRHTTCRHKPSKTAKERATTYAAAEKGMDKQCNGIMAAQIQTADFVTETFYKKDTTKKPQTQAAHLQIRKK